MKEQDKLVKALRALAPGTPMREALENILRAKTGAVIVVDDSPQVMEIVEGGFHIDSEFRPSALYELAKMDGAIIMSADGQRILRANVHLVPQAAIPSQETGIRHRIAERVARQTGAMVIAISQRRSLITLYQGTMKYMIRETGFILTKANQAVQTLEKYRAVLNQALNNLNLLEFEDVVTVYDVVRVLQRVEMVLRIAEEIKLYIVQLGSEGRLVSMQLEELATGVEEEGLAVIRDYLVSQGDRVPDQVYKAVHQAPMEELLDLVGLYRQLGYVGSMALDQPVTPRGYRLLMKLPRLPLPVVENLVNSLGSLPRIMAATIEQLDAVEGIGEVRARNIKEGLRRLREQVLLDRHK